MIERSCAGTIPDRGPAVLPELEARIEDLARQLPGRIEAGYNALLFRDVLLMIEELNTACDEYIDKSAPWKLAKQADTQPQLQTVLNTSCLLYTSDAADERSSVDLGGRRILKKKQMNDIRS